MAGTVFGWAGFTKKICNVRTWQRSFLLMRQAWIFFACGESNFRDYKRSGMARKCALILSGSVSTVLRAASKTPVSDMI